MRIFIWLLTSLLFVACSSNEQSSNETAIPKAETKAKKTFSYDQSTVAIINDVFPEIGPDTIVWAPQPLQAITLEKGIANHIRLRKRRAELIDSHGMLLTVGQKMFIPKPVTIDTLLKNGASPLFKQFKTDQLLETNLKIQSIHDYKRVKIIEDVPKTSDEIECYIGASVFSRFVFNEDKTKAAFLFFCTKMYVDEATIMRAIEVEKQGEKWQITNKIDLN